MSAKKRLKPLIMAAFASLILVLGACGNTDGAKPDQAESEDTADGMEGMDHGSMNHSGSARFRKG